MENEQVTQPQSAQTQPASQAASESKSKTGIIVIAATVFLLIAAVITMLYATQSTQQASYTNTTSSASQPTITPAGLEDEVNSIDVQSNDSDFADVDKNLQSL